MANRRLNVYTLRSLRGLVRKVPWPLRTCLERALVAAMLHDAQLFQAVAANLANRAGYDVCDQQLISRLRSVDRCGIGMWCLFHSSRRADINQLCLAYFNRSDTKLDRAGKHYVLRLLHKALTVPVAQLWHLPDLVMAISCAASGIALAFAGLVVLQPGRFPTSSLLRTVGDCAASFQALARAVEPSHRQLRADLLRAARYAFSAANAVRRCLNKPKLGAEKVLLAAECAQLCLRGAEVACVIGSAKLGQGPSLVLSGSPAPHTAGGYPDAGESQSRNVTGHDSGNVSTLAKTADVQAPRAAKTHPAIASSHTKLTARLKTFAAVCARAASNRAELRQRSSSVLEKVKEEAFELLAELRFSITTCGFTGLPEQGEAELPTIAASYSRFSLTVAEEYEGFTSLRRSGTISSVEMPNDLADFHAQSTGAAQFAGGHSGRWKEPFASGHKLGRNTTAMAPAYLNALFLALLREKPIGTVTILHILLNERLASSLERSLWQLISAADTTSVVRWLAFQLWLQLAVPAAANDLPHGLETS